MSSSVQLRSAVLLLGGHRQTLAVMRALGPLGWRNVFGEPVGRGTSFVARSRWCHSVWRHPSLATQPRQWLEALHALTAAEPDIRFLWPMGEIEMLAVDALRAELPATLRCVMVPGEVLHACLDKIRMLELASRLGIPVAPFEVVDGTDRLAAAAASVGYPCVIRPEVSSERIFGRKAFIARTAPDLERAAARRARTDGRYIVQRFVGGPRYGIYFLADHGAIRVAAQTRIHRTNRPDGSGNGVDGESMAVDATWRAHLGRLCAALDYSGVGCLQYLVDPDSGVATLLEVNPRLGANHAGNELFGMHLASWWLEQVDGRQPSIPPNWSYPHGVRYRWLQGDVEGWLHCMGSGEVDARTRLRWLRQFPDRLFSRGHLIWDPRDPMPALACYGQLATRAVHLVVSGWRQRSTLTGGRARDA